MEILLGLMSIMGFFVGLVWLIRNKFWAKKTVRPAVILLVASLLVFIVAITIAPVPAEPEFLGEPSLTGDANSYVDQQGVACKDNYDAKETESELDEVGDSEDTVGSRTAPPTAAAPSGQLIVHFIDVGQGDAILIQTPTKNILIDGGNRGTNVLNYLKYKGVNSLDLVIGSHPHADHIGGLINVMQQIPVKEVIDPAVAHTTKTFEDYLRIIDEKDIIFTEGRTGMTRDLGGGARMTILHPTSPSSRHLNDASIVAKVTFGDIGFLFTSDAEQDSERQIISSGYNLKSTILKVGHHGSSTSTTASFLNAVGPDVAIIMVGRNNRYGHPHNKTLSKLAEADVDIFRTDMHGTIIITTDGKAYEVNKMPYLFSPPNEPAGNSDAPPPASDSNPEPESVAAGKIDINTASHEELQQIVHIGPDRAQQILEMRPFMSLDELTKINGIGPARLQDINDQGIAYVE